MNNTLLITGGTGSLGNALTKHVLDNNLFNKVIIYSRSELLQYEMKIKFNNDDRLRFFIGDVRDRDRLYRAFNEVDIVVHAAALKQVPAAEYNPIEAIKTNVNGAVNVIDAAIDCGVKKVVALSTDKGVNPINLYGATKLVSDKLFVSGNSYTARKTKLSVVRYGNVSGSRGSVIPYFKTLIDKGATEIPITDLRMTRFWISLDQAVKLIMTAINKSDGGEIFVSKLPSYRITDLALAMKKDIILKQIGIRPGEKLHEVMITPEDIVYDYGDHYIIYPNLDWWEYDIGNNSGVKMDPFKYSSDKNSDWLNIESLKKLLISGGWINE